MFTGFKILARPAPLATFPAIAENEIFCGMSFTLISNTKSVPATIVPEGV